MSFTITKAKIDYLELDIQPPEGLSNVLHFKKGDIIIQLDHKGEWAQGQLSSKIGWFPKNKVSDITEENYNRAIQKLTKSMKSRCRRIDSKVVELKLGIKKLKNEREVIESAINLIHHNKVSRRKSNKAISRKILKKEKF